MPGGPTHGAWSITAHPVCSGRATGRGGRDQPAPDHACVWGRGVRRGRSNGSRSGFSRGVRDENNRCPMPENASHIPGGQRQRGPGLSGHPADSGHQGRVSSVSLLEFQTPREQQRGTRTRWDAGRAGAWRASRQVRVGTWNHAAVHRIKPHGGTPEKRQDRKETPSRPRAQTPATASRSQRPTSSCAPRQAGSRTPQGGERGLEGCGRLNLEKMQTCASHRRSKRLWDPHAARTALQGPRAWRRAHLGAALRASHRARVWP